MRWARIAQASAELRSTKLRIQNSVLRSLGILNVEYGILRPDFEKLRRELFISIFFYRFTNFFKFFLGYLNRQTIQLLSNVGIPDAAFIALQNNMLQKLTNMCEYRQDAIQMLACNPSEYHLFQHVEISCIGLILSFHSLVGLT